MRWLLLLLLSMLTRVLYPTEFWHISIYHATLRITHKLRRIPSRISWLPGLAALALNPSNQGFCYWIDYGLHVVWLFFFLRISVARRLLSLMFALFLGCTVRFGAMPRNNVATNARSCDRTGLCLYSIGLVPTWHSSGAAAYIRARHAWRE